MTLIDNLISYWKLDEASGNAIDVHGSNDGIVTGATQGATGKINDAYSFDGNDYVNISNVGIANSNTYTISLWIKETGSATEQFIYGEGQTSSVTPFFGLEFRGDGADKPEFKHRDDGGSIMVLTSDTSFGDGNWHHIIGVRHSINSWELFVDNVSVGTNNTSVGTTTVNTAHIGKLERTSSQFFFNGTIDEIGIWNKALTADERTELYNSGNGLAYPFSVTGTNISINIADTFKDVDSLQINIGDVWKDVTQVQQNIGDVWKTVF